MAEIRSDEVVRTVKRSSERQLRQAFLAGVMVDAFIVAAVALTINSDMEGLFCFYPPCP